jgi:hypothetical protein
MSTDDGPVAAPDDATPDPVGASEVDIEMPATDVGTDAVAAADIEIEMPAIDVSTDSVAMADVTSEMPPPTDVPDDPFAGGADL